MEERWIEVKKASPVDSFKHFADTFLVARQRDRITEILRKPSNWMKAAKLIPHSLELHPSVHRLQVGALPPSQIADHLNRLGATPDVLVISSDSDVNGAFLPLRAAMELIVGNYPGTLVICGERLAYHEAEGVNQRFVLQRSSNR